VLETGRARCRGRDRFRRSGGAGNSAGRRRAGWGAGRMCRGEGRSGSALRRRCMLLHLSRTVGEDGVS
jgi:hypothetical protein